MYIPEYEKVEIVLKKIDIRWIKKIGTYEVNKPIIVDWKSIKNSSFRKLKIKVKCDDCGLIHERRIRDLNETINIHYCKKCLNKGFRNPSYGKKMPSKTKDSLNEWRMNNNNPFTWESSKEKIKEKNPWEKISNLNKGKKRSKETRKIMSESALLAFKEGRRKYNSGWSKKHIRYYKGISYMSKYELNFLLYMESINMLEKIENGPQVQYINNNKDHTYFIDFILKGTKIVFEIKSTYYWNKKIEINLLKMEAASKLYTYNLVMDNNFDNIKEIINENI